MKDTFTIWGVQDTKNGRFIEVYKDRETARQARFLDERVVKLSCQIVPQKPKRKAVAGKCNDCGKDVFHRPGKRPS